MKIGIKGLPDLKAELDEKKKIKAAQTIVKYHGSVLNRTMQRKAVFKGHMGYKPGVKGKVFIKPTGATRRSILLNYRPSTKGATASVRPYTNYAAYLELGTRFMPAQPFVRPALNEVEKGFIKDLARIGHKGSETS